MKLIICSVWDRKSEEYQGLYTCKNLAVAMRDFSAAVNSRDSRFAEHAEDYVLYKIAEMDTETGEIVNNLSLVIEAVEVIRRSERDVEVNQLSLLAEA